MKLSRFQCKDKSETLSSNMSVKGVHVSRFLDIDKVRKCFSDSQRGIAINRCGFGWHFPTVHQKRKKPPEYLPRAISCKGRLVLHQLDITGDDFEDTSLCSIRCSVSLHPDTTDDMDSRAFLELVQILDGVAFPCNDTEPGSVNDVTAILCSVAVVGGHGEIGNFGVHEVLHVNASDDVTEFDSV